MQVSVETSVGNDATDIQTEGIRRIGEIVEAAVLNSTELASLPALEAPKKYHFTPPNNADIVYTVTVWVDRDKAFKVLWDIITSAPATLRAQTTEEHLVAQGEEMMLRLENERGLRPATTYDHNELRLNWGEGGAPEERQRG